MGEDWVGEDWVGEDEGWARWCCHVVVTYEDG